VKRYIYLINQIRILYKIINMIKIIIYREILID